MFVCVGGGGASYSSNINIFSAMADMVVCLSALGFRTEFEMKSHSSWSVLFHSQGNPGVAEYYTKFAEKLSLKIGCNTSVYISMAVYITLNSPR